MQELVLRLSTEQQAVLGIQNATRMNSAFSWVAVKELKLSYCIGETPLFTIYTHYGNLI